MPRANHSVPLTVLMRNLSILMARTIEIRPSLSSYAPDGQTQCQHSCVGTGQTKVADGSSRVICVMESLSCAAGMAVSTRLPDWIGVCDSTLDV